MAFISTALQAQAGLHYMRLNSSEMTLILRHFSVAADSALLRADEITPAIDRELKDQTKIPSIILSLSLPFYRSCTTISSDLFIFSGSLHPTFLFFYPQISPFTCVHTRMNKCCCSRCAVMCVRCLYLHEVISPPPPSFRYIKTAFTLKAFKRDT